jgi:hypothetical protein
MVQSSDLHRRVILYLNISLLLSVLSWVVLLIRAAGQLKDMQAPVDYAVTAGPLILGHLSKHEVPGGFSVQISLGVGLAWYVVAWIALGGLTAYGIEKYSRWRKV